MGDFGLILKHMSLIQLHTGSGRRGERGWKEEIEIALLWATGRGDDREQA